MSFRLFPLWGYYQQCCCEYSCTSFCVDIFFSILLVKYLEVEMLGHMVTLCNFLRSCQLCSKVAAPPPAVCEVSKFSTSLATLAIVCLFFLFYFLYLFLAVSGLRFCARVFSSCGKQGPLFIAVRGPLTIAASLVAEHRLQKCRLSSCGSWA